MKPSPAILASLVLGACVSTATKPPSPAQPAAATQASSVAPIAASAASPAAPESEVAHWAKSQGYVLTTVRQRSLWCKKEYTVASTIAQRTCLTENDLAMFRQINERNKEALLNSAHACPNASCTKGN
jgi:hypothetical protein